MTVTFSVHEFYIVEGTKRKRCGCCVVGRQKEGKCHVSEGWGCYGERGCYYR